MLAVYSTWAKDERQRLDGPPRGGDGSGCAVADPNCITRADIEELIGLGQNDEFWVKELLIHFLHFDPFLDHMFLHNRVAEDVSDAQDLPLYKKLSRDCRIEGRVCRGEDRVEVSFKGRGSGFGGFL